MTDRTQEQRDRGERDQQHTKVHGSKKLVFRPLFLAGIYAKLELVFGIKNMVGDSLIYCQKFLLSKKAPQN